MIKTKDIRNHIPRLKMGKHHIFAEKLNVYLDQQQSKEERAKKEHELLGLYREKDILQDKRSSINMSYEDFGNHELTIQIRKLRKQIKALEEELK